MPALPLKQAALALGKSESTLRRWCEREGAPIACPGRKGKRGAGLYDIAAIRAWREQRQRKLSGTDALNALRMALPQLVSEALWQTFCAAAGPHKMALANELAAAGHRILYALEDLGVNTSAPNLLNRLRLIAHQN